MTCNIDDTGERIQRSIFRVRATEGKTTYAGFAKDPEWIKLRTALLRILKQHPAARTAVLEAIETNRGWTSDEETDGEPNRV